MTAWERKHNNMSTSCPWCHNVTRLVSDQIAVWVSTYLSSSSSLSNSSQTPADIDDDGSSYDDGNALYYIVAVLGFYAFAIMLMMIKYMKAEQREVGDAKQYAKAMHQAHQEYLNSQKHSTAANRLALQAFNTAHAVPQTTVTDLKVTFV